MKEKDKLSDAECQQAPILSDPAQCQVHSQSLVQCANGRLRQVKQAREMDERSMAGARAWQEQANAARAELNKLLGTPDVVKPKEGENS